MNKTGFVTLTIAMVSGSAVGQVGRAVSADASADNFLTETITVDDGYNGNGQLGQWGANRMFGITSRPAVPGTAFIPNPIRDDSIAAFDPAGIVGFNDNGRFFGASGTLDQSTNPTGDGQAEWTFDISGAGDVLASIDMGMTGNWANFSIGFSYSIDGAPAQPLFNFTAPDLGVPGAQFFVESGDSTFYSSPLNVDGVQMTNNFDTYTSGSLGSGSTLTIAFDVSVSDRFNTGFAFRNIVIDRVPAPGTAAVVGLVGLGAMRRRR